MKATVIAIGLVLALSVSAIPAGAQRDQEETDEDRQRQRQQQQGLERIFADQERATQRMLDAMNEKMLAGIDEAPRMRLRFFVREIEKFALEIEEFYYTSVSGDWSQDDLDRRAKDLEETTGQLRDFVNFQSDPPQINVLPLPEENLAQRIQQLVNLSGRLIPNIISVALGDSVDLNLLKQVRDDLAITEALSLALPQSEF